jgi:Ribbon-helix-helix protein, copG family
MRTEERTRESFTTRLNFIEQPSVADELQRRAIRAGHSVSDEIRAALRLYLAGDKR